MSAVKIPSSFLVFLAFEMSDISVVLHLWILDFFFKYLVTSTWFPNSAWIYQKKWMNWWWLLLEMVDDKLINSTIINKLLDGSLCFILLGGDGTLALFCFQNESRKLHQITIGIFCVIFLQIKAWYRKEDISLVWNNFVQLVFKIAHTKYCVGMAGICSSSVV